MLNHGSAREREETPHINPTQNDTLKLNRCSAVGLRQQAESVIQDGSTDPRTRSRDSLRT